MFRLYSFRKILALTFMAASVASPCVYAGQRDDPESRNRGRRTVVKPLNIRGRGVVAALPLEGPQAWQAFGVATLLGRYRAEGGVQIDAFTSPSTADFSNTGPAIFTAANGDEIHFEFAGEITLREDGSTVWIATFVPLEGSGTGRFSRVSGGSLVMIAHGEPIKDDGSVPYRWRGHGTLEFSR